MNLHASTRILLATLALTACGPDVDSDLATQRAGLGSDPAVASWSYSVEARVSVTTANTMVPLAMPVSPMPLPGAMQEVGYSWTASASPTGGWTVLLCDASVTPEFCVNVTSTASGVTRSFVGHSSQAQLRFQIVANGALPTGLKGSVIQPAVNATVTVVNAPSVLPLAYQYAMSRIGPTLLRGQVTYTQVLPREQLPPAYTDIRSVNYAWNTSYVHPAMTVQLCAESPLTTVCTNVTGARSGTLNVFSSLPANTTVFSYRFYVDDPNLGALSKLGPTYYPSVKGGLNTVDVSYVRSSSVL